MESASCSGRESASCLFGGGEGNVKQGGSSSDCYSETKRQRYIHKSKSHYIPKVLMPPLSVCETCWVDIHLPTNSSCLFFQSKLYVNGWWHILLWIVAFPCYFPPSSPSSPPPPLEDDRNLTSRTRIPLFSTFQCTLESTVLALICLSICVKVWMVQGGW